MVLSEDYTRRLSRDFACLGVLEDVEWATISQKNEPTLASQVVVGVCCWGFGAVAFVNQGKLAGSLL